MPKVLHLLAAASALFLAACAYVPPPSPVRYETGGNEDIWSDGMRLHPAPTRPLAFRAYLPAEGLILEPVDPEIAIRNAHREVTDAKGEMEHDRGVEAMVHLPLLLLDLAATPSETPEQAREDRKFWEDERKSAEERDARHQERMRIAGERRDQWSERALRKTTLFPGMRALGTVSFVENTASMRPDSLVLRYRGGDGLEEDHIVQPLYDFPLPAVNLLGGLPQPGGTFPPVLPAYPSKNPFQAFFPRRSGLAQLLIYVSGRNPNSGGYHEQGHPQQQQH